MGLIWRMVYNVVSVVAAERETRKTDTTIQRAGASAEVLVRSYCPSGYILKSCRCTCIIGTDCSEVQGG